MVGGLKPEGLVHPLHWVEGPGSGRRETQKGPEGRHISRTQIACHTRLRVSLAKLNTHPRTFELADKTRNSNLRGNTNK
jgi:hypothetical protein